MLFPILLAILAFYYFMRKWRRDNENNDEDTMLLPGTRFDSWELASAEP